MNDGGIKINLILNLTKMMNGYVDKLFGKGFITFQRRRRLRRSVCWLIVIKEMEVGPGVC